MSESGITKIGKKLEMVAIVLSILLSVGIAPMIADTSTYYVQTWQAGEYPLYHVDASDARGVIISDPSASEAKALVHEIRNKDSHITFGPYETLPVGDYKVDFKLKVPDNLLSGDAFVLDVVSEVGEKEYVSRKIRYKDFDSSGEWQTFTLEFTMGEETEKMEYRVAPGSGHNHPLYVDTTTRSKKGETPSPSPTPTPTVTPTPTPTPTITPTPTPAPTKGLTIFVRPDKYEYTKGEEIGITVTATGDQKGNLERNKFEIYRFKGLGIAAQYFPTEFDASKSSEGIYKIKFAGGLEEGENQIRVYYDSSPYDADKRPKVYGSCSIEVTLAPAELPESKGPLQVEFDCPSKVSPGSEFNIIAKIKNPSKSAYGWYAIFKKEDVKNIRILSPYIQLADQPKIYPDYVGSDFYEKWKQDTLPEGVIVEGGKALLLKKIDPLFVFGLLTGTPTDPPATVAMLAECPIDNEIKRSTKNFVLFTCNEAEIREGIPIPPCTNLIIEIPAKAPPTKGKYEIGLSIPYEHTSREVGGFSPGGMAIEWDSVELSSGVAVGTETVNVPGFEAVFAIAGLLAVVHILRRRK